MINRAFLSDLTFQGISIYKSLLIAIGLFLIFGLPVIAQPFEKTVQISRRKKKEFVIERPPEESVQNSIRSPEKPIIGRALENHGEIKKADPLREADIADYQGKYICFSKADIVNTPDCPPVENIVRFFPHRFNCFYEPRMFVLDPYWIYTKETRPSFRWTAINEAEKYTIYLKGVVDEFDFYLETNKNYFEFPEDMPSFKYKNLYRITIFAKNGEEDTISSQNHLFNITDEGFVNRIDGLKQTLESLGMPREELIKDLDTIYMRKSLIMETVPLLESLVAAGNRDPEASMLLGDRYFHARFPLKALRQYKKARILAKNEQKPEFIALTEERLALVVYSETLLHLIEGGKTFEGHKITAKDLSEPLRAGCHR